MDNDSNENPVLDAVKEEIHVEHWTRRDRWTIRIILLVVFVNLTLVILRVLGILL